MPLGFRPTVHRESEESGFDVITAPVEVLRDINMTIAGTRPFLPARRRRCCNISYPSRSGMAMSVMRTSAWKSASATSAAVTERATRTSAPSTESTIR